MSTPSPAQIIEALLFSSPQPLNASQIASFVGIKLTETRKIIKELNDFYNDHQRAFSIQKVANGYQLRTAPEYKKWVHNSKVMKPLQLSKSVLETLSIVAYKQPITRGEIEEIRTVDSTYTVRSLLNKKLIRISGKKDIPGRPLLYSTTRHFLELFGLKNLSELPLPEDLDLDLKIAVDEDD